MEDKKEHKILESWIRSWKIFKVVYEEEGDAIDYPTIMCALGKFTAIVLLAVQEQGKVLDIEEDFMNAVKEAKASMGKGIQDAENPGGT